MKVALLPITNKFFTETIRGLMQLGWIEISELPKQKGEENKVLWDWLATKAKSKYIEFPKRCFLLTKLG